MNMHDQHMHDGDARERILSLTDDYLNGTLGPAETAELEALLTEDPVARQAFLDASLLHAQLAATPVAIAGFEKVHGGPHDAVPGAQHPQKPEVFKWKKSMDDFFHGQLGYERGVEATSKGDRHLLLRKKSQSPDTQNEPVPKRSLAGAAAVAAGLLLAAACLLLIVTKHAALPQAGGDHLTRPATAPQHGDDSHYDNRQLSIAMVAVLHEGGSQTEAADAPAARDREITLSTLESAADGMWLTSASGADVRLEGASRFGFASSDSGALYSGSVRARVEDPSKTFSVVASNLRIVDLGTEFRVSQVDDDHVAVTVLDGDVEVQSRVRLPVSYWPFDDRENSQPLATDAVQGLPAAFGSAIQRCDGIVGPGAVRFDNSNGSFARVQGGNGEKVGLGTLSAAEGITVEALIISQWTAASMDYDEIYRKEDGNCRVLLCFQNDGDRHTRHAEPAVAPGPCLSFGLHLAGCDYKELDMPLDGRDGRPTVADLTDGRPHHIVATFDSFTGRKAIFIDGTLRLEHGYPPGTVVLNGGPEPAFIGSHLGIENFNGVIDELAFYDFALTAEEIAEHHRRARRGETYFGTQPIDPKPGRWQAITRVTEGQTRVFNSHTGLPR